MSQVTQIGLERAQAALKQAKSLAAAAEKAAAADAAHAADAAAAGSSGCAAAVAPVAAAAAAATEGPLSETQGEQPRATPAVVHDEVLLRYAGSAKRATSILLWINAMCYLNTLPRVCSPPLSYHALSAFAPSSSLIFAAEALLEAEADAAVAAAAIALYEERIAKSKNPNETKARPCDPATRQ